MLLEFTVGNFLSFKDKVTLDLTATGIKDYKDTNLIQTERHKLLKGAVIYGANSSGKSNLIRSMSTMKRLLKQSFEMSSTSALNIQNYLLSSETENAPSFFEVVFIINNITYRYGFEVDNKSIHSEWLFEAKKITEKPLFIREKNGIEVFNQFPEGKNLEERTRENALFLTVSDQFNGKIAKKIMNWFSTFITISGLKHEHYTGITFEMLENEEMKHKLEKFYDDLDLGFNQVTLEKRKFDPNELPDDMPEAISNQILNNLEGKEIAEVKTSHTKFDSDNQPLEKVKFDMQKQESSGTNKAFNISGPVFDVLNEGGILMIDELDSSLHPHLTLAIIRLFHSKEENPYNAQLIFTTHDTNLLNYGKYRRDQIYFTEKDYFGSSTLFSLVEYNEGNTKVRKDRSFEKDYIEGRYGAIPFIGDLKIQ